MPTLHIGQKIKNKKTNEPIIIKTILGWVFMGGESEIYHKCVTSNKLNLQNLDTVSEPEKHFWELETFGTETFIEKQTKDCKSTSGLSRKDDRQSLFCWLIAKRTQVSFSFNRDLAIMPWKPLENKFKKDREFHKTY